MTSESENIGYFRKCASVATAVVVACFIGVYLLLCSCGKEDPEEGGHGEKPVPPELEIEINLSLPELSFDRRENLSDAFVRRFVIELRAPDMSVVARKVWFCEIQDNGLTTTSVTLQSAPGRYGLAVWSDYVRKVNPEQNVNYDVSSLIPVRLYGDYSGNMDSKDCFTGYRQLEFQEGTASIVSIDMELERPVGRVEFISEDLERFRGVYEDAISSGTVFEVRVTYPEYIATSYNVAEKVLKNLISGVAYRTPLDVGKGDESIMLCFDYMFIDGNDAEIPAVIEILKQGEVIAANRILIPMKCGRNSVVRGKFLTTDQNGGVSVDIGYDGIVDIDLGKI